MGRSLLQKTGGATQLSLDAYFLDGAAPDDLVTTTRDPLGSRDQRSESPASTPRTLTTVEGTVVRSESDRSTALTNLDSIGFGTGFSLEEQLAILEAYDLLLQQRIGQHAGITFKYGPLVGQYVGRLMVNLSDKLPVRKLRALEMLRRGVRALETSTLGRFLVPSEKGIGFHEVNGIGIEGSTETCDCDDFVRRDPSPCKHVWFARLWIQDPLTLAAQVRGQTSTRRKKIDWPSYNRSQTAEGRLFPVLLSELCKGVVEPERDAHQAGRPAIPLRDQIFCAVDKVRDGVGCRRTDELRVSAAAKGQIGSFPTWQGVSDFLCQPEITPVLLDIIARSALPLAAIENRCAIDSTGFRTTRFHYYRNERYTPERKNIWMKLHAAVGIRTHAILAATITEGTAGDAPQLPLLMERAAAGGFKIKEVMADKAYGSRANFEVVASYDALLFSPPKSNATGKANGSRMYHRMFQYFNCYREEFDKHYGDRAQVESAFGAMKQTLGETLLSRKIDSQVNELYCKAISHNVRMLIRAMYECGVLPNFLAPPPADRVDIPAGLPSEATVKLSENWPIADPPVGVSPLPK